MPTVTETIQYALQGPSGRILNYEGSVPDPHFTDRRAEEFWSDTRTSVEHLHDSIVKALTKMGIADQIYGVVRRRIITVTTDPEIVED